MSVADLRPPVWVDTHSHLLPAVDDGARSIDMALAMLRRGVTDGIRAAVLTPHIGLGDGPATGEVHCRRFEELRTAVADAGVPVELHLGAEIAFRSQMEEVARWPWGCLARSRYVLVDLPAGPLSPGLEREFYRLRSAGYRPILAHPERKRRLMRSRELLARLRDQELLVQIGSMSLTGEFGRRAQRAAEMLLARRWVELVASDAHDLSRRPFTLSRAATRVAQLHGRDEVSRLFQDNPRRILANQEVTTLAEPEDQGRRAGPWQRLVSVALGHRRSEGRW